MKAVGELFGTSFWMRYSDPPVIVVRWRMSQQDGDALAVHGLVHALGGAGTIQRREDGWMQAEIPYKDVLDHTLMELIDLLITIRYMHPRMVQLPLNLTEEDARELERILTP